LKFDIKEYLENGISMKYAATKNNENKRQMYRSALGLLVSSKCLLGHLLITFAFPSKPARRGEVV